MAYGKVRIDQIQSTTRTVNVDDLTLDSDLGTAAALNAGTASGNVPVLDGAGKIVSSVLPSYVDDVVEYANLAAFPVTGETGKIYVAIDTNKTYRWSGSAYIEISSSPVTSVAGRTGVVTLSNTDISGLGTAATTAATDYAPAAQGVTNGNSHDHNGGDGAQIAYSSLSGLPTLGTAAAKNTGTASGNVVELDGSARLPAVDGSLLTGLVAATDLTYTAATRVLASSTGTDATLTLVTSTDAGLVPATGGGTTNFLRADGTFAAPPGGSPGGSTTQVQFNNAGSFGGDADLTWNSTTNVLGVTGDVNLSDGGAYTTTLQCITPTAARTVSIPDATGTVALVAGSSGQLTWNNAGANAGASTLTYDGSILTSSGRFINSYNAIASSPAKAFTGTWFTGGTSTTTKPQVLIEPTGATSTAWSTSGTGLGVNAASGFAGRLLDLQLNGTSNFNVSSAGGFSASGSSQISGISDTRLTVQGAGTTGQFLIPGLCQGGFSSSIGGTGFMVRPDGFFGWGTINFSSVPDLSLSRDAADTLAQRRGTNAQVTRVYDTFTSATDYHRIAIATARATLTGVTGASVTATALIPAGAVVMGVTSKVTTALGTANGTTGYQVGTAADPDRWGAITGTALGTTSDNRNWTAGTIECFPTATDVIVTATGGNFNGTGVIYLSVQYMTGQAD